MKNHQADSPNNSYHQTLECLAYCESLHSQPINSNLKNRLRAFIKEKEPTIQNFLAGIKKFIQLSNVTYHNRCTYYGNKLGGLHYAPDLIEQWGYHTNRSLNEIDVKLPILVSSEWTAFYDNLNFAYKYEGSDASAALNKLVQGPTIIDCGMYCQLALLFGMRYILGDTKFDKFFGEVCPLLITQSLFKNERKAPQSCLQEFVEDTNEIDRNEVSLAFLPNTPYYILKHLAGCYSGMNCIVMNDNYFCFDPNIQVYKKENIMEQLLTEFNKDQDIFNQQRLELYEIFDPELLHPELLVPYGQLIYINKGLASMKISLEELNTRSAQFNVEQYVKFNFNLFIEKANLIRLPHENKKTELFNNRLTEAASNLSLFPTEKHRKRHIDGPYRTDEEMKNSAFGQASDTAGRYKIR